MTSVTDDAVTEVGNSAFADCAGLKTVAFDQSVDFGGNAFSNCVAIMSITIPVGSTLGANLLEGCASLKTISVPENVTVEELAFSGSSIQQATFNGEITVKSYLFGGVDSKIQTIVFNKNATIADGAFNFDAKLRVFIPATVRTIGSYAMYGVKSIYVQAASKSAGWDENWIGYRDSSQEAVHWGASGLPGQ